MKRDTSNAPTVYGVEEMRQYAEALPACGQTPILNERAAQAARSVLGHADPAWEQRLKDQIEGIMAEIEQYLIQDAYSGHYTVTPNELRGIVARATSRASSQCAIDLGKALVEASAIAANVNVEVTSTPAAPRLLGLQQEF
jgi:hypothetical protein